MMVFVVEPPTATGMIVPPSPPLPPTATTEVSLSAVPVPPERAEASDWAPLLDELAAKPSEVTTPEAPVLPEPWLVASARAARTEQSGVGAGRRAGGDAEAARGLPRRTGCRHAEAAWSLAAGVMLSRPVLTENGLGVAEPVLPLPPVVPELETGLDTAADVASPVAPELVAED